MHSRDLAAGATATVTVNVNASGPGPYVNNASAGAEEDDPNPANNHDTTTTNLNLNPICNATASGPEMWPPNHKLVRFTVGGATDPDGDIVLVRSRASYRTSRSTLRVTATPRRTR